MMKIHDSAVLLKGAVVSGQVTLEEGVSVWYNSVLRGDAAAIHVGKNTNIQENCVVHVDINQPCVIGHDVTVGHGAILHGCTIGSITIIGMGSIVLSGAVIGKNCMIAAGSLITGKTVIPDGSLVMGSPAEVKRPLSTTEILQNEQSALAYLTLSQREKRVMTALGS